MGALQLLSAANWGMGILYLSIPAFLGVATNTPRGPLIVVTLICLVLAAPSFYLGANIDKGRGRRLQTLLAVLSLLNVPLGTAYGVLALWACWREGSDADFGEEPVIRRAGAPADFEDGEADVDDGDEDDGQTPPFEYARGLADRGVRAHIIQDRLLARGLSEDEVETLLGAVGFDRLPPRRRPPTSGRPPAGQAARPARGPRRNPTR